MRDYLSYLHTLLLKYKTDIDKVHLYCIRFFALVKRAGRSCFLQEYRKEILLFCSILYDLCQSVVHRDSAATVAIESGTQTACSFRSIPRTFDPVISFIKNHFGRRLSDIRSRFPEQHP